MPKQKPPPTRLDADQLDFEQALAALEQLVGQLESGEQPLEQALESFERGVILARRCQAALRSAEQRVEILTGDSVTAEPEPFEPHS